MWAPGSRPGPGQRRGFTLLELLLVVAIIAIASAGVMMASRAPEETQLAREADRLAALLEAARAESRSSGVAVTWQAETEGFRFAGLMGRASPLDGQGTRAAGGTVTAPWLSAGVVVRDGGVLSLGPEPIIGAQAVVLALGRSTIRVATDGLRPFQVEPENAATGPVP